MLKDLIGDKAEVNVALSNAGYDGITHIGGGSRSKTFGLIGEKPYEINLAEARE